MRTADERIVVQRRSESVFEYPGFFHVCGGNVEPADVAGADAPGVFASARRELDEELGIGAGAITELTCLGLAENAETFKPELLTVVDVDLSADDFASANHAEYSQLVFIDADADALGWFLDENCGTIAPGGLACLLNVGLRQFGAAWSAKILESLDRNAQQRR